MLCFSNDRISLATATDFTAVKYLLNSAYRGEGSKQGWTTEAHLIGGDIRTDDASLRAVMQQAGSVFLKYTNQQHQLIGCVNLQQRDNKIYLGMFSVSPQCQGEGIGKQLLYAAEEYATCVKCKAIFMWVISLRLELINWYKRYGYVDTGERIAFKEDGISGKHAQPLEFMVMEKAL